ncbi:hypothetical protein Tco_1575937 [Tanacetum coccineum]
MKSRKEVYIQNTSDDDSEKENDELRLHLTITPDEEKEVDYEILDRKYPIKEWKTECLGTKPQADKAKHIEEINQNVIREGFDRILWGDLMVMFNPDDEDKFWNSQQDWNIVNWKLHGSSGVYTLVTKGGLVIHMMVEKKYPLKKEVLVQILKLKLESEEDNTMALELIGFIKKLLAEIELDSHKLTACAQPTPSPALTSEVPHEPQTDSSPAHTSELPLEQQPDPSPRPSPIPIIPDSIPETSGGNLGDQAKEIQHLKAQIKKLKQQAKPIIHHHRAWLKSVSLKQRLIRKSFPKKQKVHKESVSKQDRKFAKGESSVQRDPLFDELPEDTVDHIETENAQDEGRTRDILDEDKEIEENVFSTEDVLSTDKDKVSTDKEKVSTNGSKVSTDRQIEGTDEQVEGTKEHNEGTEEHNEGTKEHIEGIEKQIESTNGQRKGTEDHTEGTKAISREKEKGVELKDIEEADRPRPTSTRSLLTLKPLPKIDPKDKGKKKIEEEDESESESDGIPEAEKKFKQLESDEEMARKIQEEWEGEEERNKIAEEKAANEALIRNFDDIKARIEADRLLAEKLQEQEREQFTIEERAKFLHDTIAAQRKFLAQQLFHIATTLYI